MSKTPITDKLVKYLKVLEKVNFANTLDTGFDTSRANQAWTQSGQDFDKALGLDNLKAGLGTDEAGTLDIAPQYGSDKAKVKANIMSSRLFANLRVRGKKIDLLQARQSSTQEHISPYLWSGVEYEPLVEESNAVPIPVSNVNNLFWRIDPGSDIVFTKRVNAPSAFLPYFYTVAKSERLDAFIHTKMGVPPAPGLESIRQIAQYTNNNYKDILSQAIEIVKQLAPGESNTILLNNLNGLNFVELLPVVSDCITVGILDAANACIHPENETSVSGNRVGWQILSPDIALDALQDLINGEIAHDADMSPILPEPLKAKIHSMLKEIETAPSVFDSDFIMDLKKATELRKFNIAKNSSSSKTTIVFVVSQIVNQVKKVFGATIDSAEEEAKFYFGKLGLGAGGVKARADEQNKYLGHSLVNTTSPMVVLRGRTPETSNDDNVFVIDSHILDIDIKSNNRAFELLNLKPIGLSSSVHYHIKHEAQSKYNGDYITAFSKIPDSTATIQGATYGRIYWEQILRTCYRGGDDFESGVFFVGLSPLFWDKPNGKTIYTSVVAGDLVDRVELPYAIHGTDEYSTDKFYTINNAAAIFYDRTIHPNGQSGEPKEAPIQVIRERHKKIINDPSYQFQSLEEIRDNILKVLYNLDTSSEKDLREQATGVLYKVFKNIEAGFWTMDGPELKDGTLLACYNPWEYGEKTKKFRFYRENTNQATIQAGQEAAKGKYLAAGKKK